MSKDLDKQVEKLEELTDANTVIKVGGFSFTPAKIMIAGSILSAALGGLYGAFEVYKTYEDMKEKISQYEAPDLTEIEKKLAVVSENAEKSVQYTQDIKNDLKQDIRRLENVVESVERNQKQSSRETDQDVRQLRKEIDSKIQKALDNPLAK